PPLVWGGKRIFFFFFLMGVVSKWHIFQGHGGGGYSISLIISIVIGAQMGVRVKRSMKSDTVVMLFRTVLLIMGVYLIIKSFI
ncbi:hypothetical protein ACEF20_12375, partial [Staphylococcus epidermidis]